MPIQLTTPKSVGDLDPDAPGGAYAQAKIVRQQIDLNEKRINVLVAYGNTVASEWVQGHAIRPMDVGFQDWDAHPNPEDLEGDPIPASTDFSDLVSIVPENTTDSLYDQVKKALYEALISKGYFAGTIV